MSIYFIRETPSGLVKIGYAKNVEKRRKSLQTGIPGEITTIRVIDGDRDGEAWMHRHFSTLRVRGE